MYNIAEYSVVLAKASDSPVERLARGVRYRLFYMKYILIYNSRNLNKKIQAIGFFCDFRVAEIVKIVKL